MNEEVNQIIVNNYANHILPVKEKTDEEYEKDRLDFIEALKKYGWK